MIYRLLSKALDFYLLEDMRVKISDMEERQIKLSDSLRITRFFTSSNLEITILEGKKNSANNLM